jgi:hypothetical protein
MTLAECMEQTLRETKSFDPAERDRALTRLKKIEHDYLPVGYLPYYQGRADVKDCTVQTVDLDFGEISVMFECEFHQDDDEWGSSSVVLDNQISIWKISLTKMSAELVRMSDQATELVNTEYVEAHKEDIQFRLENDLDDEDLADLSLL